MNANKFKMSNPNKKYKSYKENPTNKVPYRTVQRWQNKTGNNQAPLKSFNEIPTCSKNSIEARTGKYKNWKDSPILVPITTLRRWENNYPTVDYDVSSETGEDFRGFGSLSSNSPLKSSTSSVSSSILSTISSSSSSLIEDYVSSESHSLNRESLRGDDLLSDNEDVSTVKSQKMLYDQADVTLDQAVLSILNIWIKQNLTKITLKEQLELLNFILPRENCLPKTVHTFFKYVENQVPPCSIIKHYFCKKCSIYLSSSLTDTCSNCGENKISFFFELDFIDQLKRILETSGITKLFKDKETVNYITDITSGTEYRRVNFGRQKYDLTLLLYTDGISLSKSSKSHCWPLMYTIAELPPEIRNSYIVTAGLWFDVNLKPPMNLFLQPFCKKLKKYFNNGIQWVDPVTGNLVISRIRAPLLIADAPARAQILNMLNFNGSFGCNICEVETIPCKQFTKKRIVRIYPYNKHYTLREGCVMEGQAQIVDDSTELRHVKGVKGFSIVSYLPSLNLGTCVIPEYMHSVLLGVVKQFLRIWLCKRGPWKIKKHVQKIDEFLLKIKPLKSFARYPRSILDFKSYKATELYNWVMFYSLPALEHILPAKYLQHWMLLVISLFYLLQQKIKPNDIKISNRLLHRFVKEVKTLYGDCELSYNIHQLVHLCLCVERWGPLWATSAFPFESHNGFLAKLVHGSNKMGQEMMNNLRIVEGASIIRSKVKSKDVSPKKKSFYFELLGKRVRYKNNIDFLLSNNLDPKAISFYSRVKVNNDFYTSLYYKTTKTNNYTIQLKLNDGSLFIGIIQIFFEAAEKLNLIVNCFDVDEHNIFQHNSTGAVVSHIIPIRDTSNLILIKLEEIKYISHLIRVGKYICKKPNFYKSVL